MKLCDKRLFLLDMDGTIYLSETLFDGSAEFLDTVKRKGGRYVFLTNNSSRGTDAYIEKMHRLGIETSDADFFTSADAAVMTLDRSALYYVCGTGSLKGQLLRAGFRLSEKPSDDVDTVLLGYDTELTYQKLEDCCILLMRGAGYIATHPDLVCPTWYGSAPDCGSVIEMLFTCTGRRPTRIIGKPQPDMALAAMKKFGCTPEETCLVGDRVYTDIACGVNAGIDTVFVLSGEGVPSDCGKYGVRPTYTMRSIRELLDNIR
ncbi:MAG: HAD-IIA family hydrolase [Lachnospiraceae bacterium]|nr:HAD-IIA family hydrolase [Lachnospiraceae bacterium]